MIGSFGEIVFETSRKKIHTFDEFQRKRKAIFAEHAVLDDKPRLQHIGNGLDEITFSIRLDISLGVDPKGQLEKIHEIQEAGEAKKLIIGGDVFGTFVLEEIEESWAVIDNKGRLINADLNLNLKEFVSDGS
ncbi:MAG: phage tail protein [Desulfobacteraceae bacterium]|nr:phage tail protein [Desulfobacteraceae bacterium]